MEEEMRRMGMGDPPSPGGGGGDFPDDAYAAFLKESGQASPGSGRGEEEDEFEKAQEEWLNSQGT